MKELTNNAAISDAVYEMNLNGSYPIVKLTAVTLDIKEHEEMSKHGHGCGCQSFPEAHIYHFTHPRKDEKVMYNQPLPAGGEIPVFNGGKAIGEDKIQSCMAFEKGEYRVSTSKKVVARGPIWIWAAIAIGVPPEGSSQPYLVVEAAGTFGSDDTTEGEMIGAMDGKRREMTARLVRRANLMQLTVAAIRTEYRYTFVEQNEVGKAKVKEG